MLSSFTIACGLALLLIASLVVIYMLRSNQNDNATDDPPKPSTTSFARVATPTVPPLGLAGEKLSVLDRKIESLDNKFASLVNILSAPPPEPEASPEMSPQPPLRQAPQPPSQRAPMKEPMYQPPPRGASKKVRFEEKPTVIEARAAPGPPPARSNELSSLFGDDPSTGRARKLAPRSR